MLTGVMMMMVTVTGGGSDSDISDSDDNGVGGYECRIVMVDLHCDAHVFGD